MNLNSSIARAIAISAIAALSSFAAHANGEGDDAPELKRAITSTVSVAQVKAEARTPIVISNGSTGYTAVMSTRSREEVRAEARAAVRNGTTPAGERGSM